MHNNNQDTSPQKAKNKQIIITEKNFLQIANLPYDQCTTLLMENIHVINYQHPNTKDSLLHLSVQKGDSNLTEFLIEQGGEIDIANNFKQTPLHIAVETKNHQIINYLIEHNANTNAQDIKGNTPMHIAADIGEYKVIRLLLFYKGNSQLKNNEGETPLDYAIDKRYQKCIDALLQLKSSSEKQLMSSAYTSSSTSKNYMELSNSINPFLFLSNFKDSHAYNNTIKNRLDEDAIEGKSQSLMRFVDQNDDLVNYNSEKESNNANTIDDDSNEPSMKINTLTPSNMTYKKKCVPMPKLKLKCNNEEEQQNSQPGSTENNKSNKEITFKKLDIISPSNENNENNNGKNSDRFSFNMSIESKLENNHHVVQIDIETNINDAFIDNEPQILTCKSKPNDIDDIEQSKDLVYLRKESTTSQRASTLLRYSQSKEYNGYEEIDYFISELGSPDESISHLPNLNEEDKEDDCFINNALSPQLNKESREGLQIIEPVDHSSQLPSAANCIYQPVLSNTTSKNNDELEEAIYQFLKEINMEMYTKTFIKEGFDDIQLLVNQMKTGFGITDENMKDVGIDKPGHRARILIKIQELSQGFDFIMPDNAVYYYNPKPFKVVKYDFKVKALMNWLKELKVDAYISSFYDAGYHSIELMYIQMVSKNPLTDRVLEEIGIDKLGYRTRIINKLKEGSFIYVSQLAKPTPMELTKQKALQMNGCGACLIF